MISNSRAYGTETTSSKWNTINGSTFATFFFFFFAITGSDEFHFGGSHLCVLQQTCNFVSFHWILVTEPSSRKKLATLMTIQPPHISAQAPERQHEVTRILVPQRISDDRLSASSLLKKNTSSLRMVSIIPVHHAFILKYKYFVPVGQGMSHSWLLGSKPIKTFRFSVKIRNKWEFARLWFVRNILNASQNTQHKEVNKHSTTHSYFTTICCSQCAIKN